ncbi:MAG TPA: carboxypeptidase-like regulatory domain-containing protein, partial [Vicinamibacterales bacterium]|nr:carboxypeptidase-like regulatory domain-containing protein [Vicinamibacterales bacterium]
PIRRAQVRLSGIGMRESRLATTDAQGRFEIRDLNGGRYSLTASKGGFVTLQYGQRRPGEAGTPIELSDAQVLDRLLIGLPRGSVISGRISDEFGEPIVNASVSAMRYAYVGGSRRLTPAGARDTTDDQGFYRLFGLSPGDYIISASLRMGEVTDPGDELSGFAPTYFPGTPDATAAQQVRVALSQEQGGVSFALAATRLVRVWGQVLSASGTPHWGGMVSLSPIGGAIGGGPARGPGFFQGNGSRIEGDGSFWITNVAPGRYQLTARAGGRDDAEFARMDVTVGGSEVGSLIVVTAPSGRITGKVVTDTGEPLPAGSPPLQVVARAASADGSTVGQFGGGGGQGRVNADGTFDVGSVLDPRYVRITTPPAWTLKAVLVDGRDVTDLPVDAGPGEVVSGVQVVITRTLSSAEGTVLDDRRQPVLDATVVLFPADERLRYFQSRFVRSARPDQEGKFRITTVPPGEYLAVAVQGIEDGQSGDPELLAAIDDYAERVTIKPGETKTVTLGLSAVPRQ